MCDRAHKRCAGPRATRQGDDRADRGSIIRTRQLLPIRLAVGGARHDVEYRRSLLGHQSLFRIKICGVATAKDAQFVTLAGADAIGLNFYALSRRFIDLTTAESIVKALPPRVARVGVFVNHSAVEIGEHVSRLKLDWIQLHGDEPPDLLAALPQIPVLKAFPFASST